MANKEDGSLDWNYIQEASKRGGYESLNRKFVLKAKCSKIRHVRRRQKALDKLHDELNNGYKLVPMESETFDRDVSWKTNWSRWLVLPEAEKVILLEVDKVFYYLIYIIFLKSLF